VTSTFGGGGAATLPLPRDGGMPWRPNSRATPQGLARGQK